jgi:hypothetical protein
MSKPMLKKLKKCVGTVNFCSNGSKHDCREYVIWFDRVTDGDVMTSEITCMQTNTQSRPISSRQSENVSWFSLDSRQCRELIGSPMSTEHRLVGDLSQCLWSRLSSGRKTALISKEYWCMHEARLYCLVRPDPKCTEDASWYLQSYILIKKLRYWH